VSLTGTGTVVVEATQPGNTFFAPAFSLQRTFTVGLTYNSSIEVPSEGSVIGPVNNRQKKDETSLSVEWKDRIQVVPNPMRSTGVIRITLAETAKSDVEIYDNGGRLVKRFAGKIFEAGHVVQLNLSTSDLPSGIYHVRVANGKERIMQSFQVSR
jgi:hypothetical protein